MRAKSFAIVFPGGDFEVDMTTQRGVPLIGDELHRKGQRWMVTRLRPGDSPAVYVQPLVTRERPSRR